MKAQTLHTSWLKLLLSCLSFNNHNLKVSEENRDPPEVGSVAEDSWSPDLYIRIELLVPTPITSTGGQLSPSSTTKHMVLGASSVPTKHKCGPQPQNYRYQVKKKVCKCLQTEFLSADIKIKNIKAVPNSWLSAQQHHYQWRKCWFLFM